MLLKQDNVQQYLEKIQLTFPELTLEHVESNFEGLVNDVLVVNQVRIFRFPRISGRGGCRCWR